MQVLGATPESTSRVIRLDLRALNLPLQGQSNEAEKRQCPAEVIPPGQSGATAVHGFGFRGDGSRSKLFSDEQA